MARQVVWKVAKSGLLESRNRRQTARIRMILLYWRQLLVDSKLFLHAQHHVLAKAPYVSRSTRIRVHPRQLGHLLDRRRAKGDQTLRLFFAFLLSLIVDLFYSVLCSCFGWFTGWFECSVVGATSINMRTDAEVKLSLASYPAVLSNFRCSIDFPVYGSY